jgi:hypothetical protein
VFERPCEQFAFRIRFDTAGGFADQELIDIAREIISEKSEYRFEPLLRFFTRPRGTPTRVDLTEIVDEFRREFIKEHQGIVSNFTEDIIRRIDEAEDLYQSAIAIGPRNDWKNAILDAERTRMSVPWCSSPGLILRRSSNLCYGCPVTFHRSIIRIEEPDYEPNAVVQILDRLYPSLIRVKRANIIIQFPHKEIVIPFNQIVAYFIRNELSGEILTTNRKAYFIANAKPSLELKSHLQGFQPKGEMPWINNFEYVLWLNRMAGRSFNDPKCYPVFPCFLHPFKDLRRSMTFAEPTPIGEITDIEKDFRNSDFIVPEFYSCPELIKAKLPAWASSPLDFVYAMRKLLESPTATRALRSWIRSVFVNQCTIKGISHHIVLMNLPDRISCESKRKPRVVTQLEGVLLLFAWIWENFIGFVTTAGRVFMYEVTDSLILRSEDKSTVNVASVECYSVRHQLWLYYKEIRTIVAYPDGTRIPIQIGSQLLEIFNGKFVYCPNSIEFWIGDQRLCRTEGKVVTFAINELFSILVFATADGNVHFRSARKGREIIPSLKIPELAESILITEKWGFIIIRSHRTMYIYSVNGEKLHELPLRAAIHVWTSFSSIFGFDYVAYANAAGDVAVFEAFDPEDVKVIITCWDVIAIRFDPISDRLMMVTSTGLVQAIPYIFTPPAAPIPFEYRYK